MDEAKRGRGGKRRLGVSRRNRVVYPRGGSPITASQTASLSVERPAPQTPRTIRIKVRLVLRPEPGGSGFSGSISVPKSFDDLPLSWKLRDFLWDSIKASVWNDDLNRGISSGQLDVAIERLRFEPPIDPGISMEELGRLSHALNWLLMGATTSLLGGIVAHWQHARFIDQPNPDPEWYIAMAEQGQDGLSGGFVGGAYRTREEAERAMRDEQRADGYRVVQARDADSVLYAYLGLPEPPELRHGQDTLTPQQARAVQPGDWLFHLGRRRASRVVSIVPDGPGAPLFETAHGLETYTLFRRLPATALLNARLSPAKNQVTDACPNERLDRNRNSYSNEASALCSDEKSVREST